MPKEKPTYREELRLLRERFPDRNVLTKKEIMEYTGRGEYWMNSHGFKGRQNLTLVQVAAILTNMI